MVVLADEYDQRGYHQIYESLLIRLEGHNLAEAAPRLGLRFHAQSGIDINFLGARYIVDNNGVRPVDGKRRKINIYNVLAFTMP